MGRSGGSAETASHTFPVHVRGPENHVDGSHPRSAVDRIEQTFGQISLVGEATEQQDSPFVRARLAPHPCPAEARPQERVTGADEFVERVIAETHVIRLNTLIDEDIAVMEDLATILDYRDTWRDSPARAVECVTPAVVVNHNRLARPSDAFRDLVDLASAVRAELYNLVERTERMGRRRNRFLPRHADRAPSLLGECGRKSTRANRMPATDRRRGIEPKDRQG